MKGKIQAIEKSEDCPLFRRPICLRDDCRYYDEHIDADKCSYEDRLRALEGRKETAGNRMT